MEGVGRSCNGEHSVNKSKGQTMKQTRLMKILGVGAVSAMAVAGVMAQTSTTVTTTADGGVTSSTTTSALNGTGTISAYTPGSDYITFRGEAGAAPVRYYYSKETPIVDSEGR